MCVVRCTGAGDSEKLFPFCLTVSSAAVLAGILLNNHRISDLSNRIGDMHAVSPGPAVRVDGKLFDEKLTRVEQVMDARLTRIKHELKIR